jgi:hypothetical protein
MVGERRRLGRRRAPARRLLRLAVPVVLAAVVVVLVVATVAQIGPSSGPFRRAVDRGYAALAAPVVVASNASGASLRSLLERPATLDRVSFFNQLDALASDAASQDRRFGALAPPAPATTAAVRCAAAMSARAAATATFRSSLEGVLGGRTGLGPVDITAAVSAVTSAGSALVGADADWAACRRGFRRAPGSAHLAASSWVPHAGFFSATAVYRLVSAVAGSRSLAAGHRLVVAAVVTAPAPVASGGTGVLAPTTRLVVQVVLADQGNVSEHGVEVGGAIQLQGAPASPVPVQRTVDLGSGGSTTVTLPAFAVQPGSSYTVQVTAESPRATGTGPIASGSLQVRVLPVATVTSVTTTPIRAVAGHSVTLVAEVVPSLSGIGPPSGTVAFSDDGATVPACAAQPLHHGKATCTMTYPAPSTHSVGAQYGGARRFSASAASAITLVVG